MAVQKTDRLLFKRDKHYQATVVELGEHVIAEGISTDTPNDLVLGTDNKLKLVKRTPIEEAVANKSSLGCINPNPVFGLGEDDYTKYLKYSAVSLVHDVTDNTAGSLLLERTSGLTMWSDNFIPWDTDLQYRATVSARYEVTGSDVDPTKEYGVAMYFGTVPFDGDKLQILPWHINGRGHTILAQPVNNGDTEIIVEDASGFYSGTTTHARSIIIHPKQADGTYRYQDSKGRLYDERKYSRIVVPYAYSDSPNPVDNGDGTWTVTLDEPWAIGDYPSGDSIGSTQSGGGYSYWVSNWIKPTNTDDWQRYSSPWSNGDTITVYRNGTVFVKVLGLLNYRLYERDIGTTTWTNGQYTTPDILRKCWFSKLKLEWRHKP